MTPPLGNNRWHHGNGVLVCGTIRVAVTDFDTQPSEQFKIDMFDWICDTLNSEVAKPSLKSQPLTK